MARWWSGAESAHLNLTSAHPRRCGIGGMAWSSVVSTPQPPSGGHCAAARAAGRIENLMRAGGWRGKVGSRGNGRADSLVAAPRWFGRTFLCLLCVK
ncbi:hypothetical protein UG55_100159 [Frankia sp. EI5c]|nr:hypothetical protein UG55_100159 [Frankia sp. EI5c]